MLELLFVYIAIGALLWALFVKNDVSLYELAAMFLIFTSTWPILVVWAYHLVRKEHEAKKPPRNGRD